MKSFKDLALVSKPKPFRIVRIGDTELKRTYNADGSYEDELLNEDLLEVFEDLPF